MEILTPTGVIPRTERVVRPLTSLPPEAQHIAWQRAVETAVPETKHVRSRAFCAVVAEGLELGIAELAPSGINSLMSAGRH